MKRVHLAYIFLWECLSRETTYAQAATYIRAKRRIARASVSIKSSTKKPESNRSQYRNEDRPWMGPRRSSYHYQFALPRAFCELRRICDLKLLSSGTNIRARASYDVHFTLYIQLGQLGSVTVLINNSVTGIHSYACECAFHWNIILFLNMICFYFIYIYIYNRVNKFDNYMRN